MDFHYVVYKTTNIITNQIYIGVHKTKIINDSYLGSGVLLRKAILEYGASAFEKSILHVFDNPDEMYDKERELVNREFVSTTATYNVCLGGSRNWRYSHPDKVAVILEKIKNSINNREHFLKVVSSESRRKMSIAKKGKPLSEEHKQKIIAYRIGKPLSEETKAKIAESNRGLKRSEETRRKISEILRASPGHNTGHKHSEESKAKMREAKRKYLERRKAEKEASNHTSPNILQDPANSQDSQTES